MKFRADTIDDRLDRTVQELHDQYQCGDCHKQRTFQRTDIEEEGQRYEDRRQQGFLSKGCFMAQRRTNTCDRVHSSEHDSPDSLVLGHVIFVVGSSNSGARGSCLRSSGGAPAGALAGAPLYPHRTLPWGLLLLFLVAVLRAGNTHADTRPADESTTTDTAFDVAPAIAVASSLRAVWPALAAAWQAELPDLTVRPTFGASHTLARQMQRGAPFEMLLSADAEAIALLQATDLTSTAPADYATGRLALVQRSAASSATADALERLTHQLADGSHSRFAIPDPQHAPYGQAARDLLVQAALWPLAPGRLVVGENAAQTLQFVYTGAVDAALVPLSLVVQRVPTDIAVHVVDAALHEPLTHRLVVLDSASPATRALAAWLADTSARAEFADAGFGPVPSGDTAGE